MQESARRSGPPLVLAAAGRERVLVVHPAAAVSRLLTTHYTDLLGREGTIAADSARIPTACQLFDQFGVTIIDLQRQDTQAALFRRWPTTYLV